MFRPRSVDEKPKLGTGSFPVKKPLISYALVFGFLLLSCGGGGGSPDSDGTDSRSVIAQDYFMRDATKVYTYLETIEASSGGQSATDELIKSFTYEVAHDIPDRYGDFSGYSGPFRKETVRKDGSVALVTYTDPTGAVMVSDDLSVFSRIQDSEYSDNFTSSLILGRSYTSQSSDDLFSSDTTEWVGRTTTTSALIPLALETVVIQGQAYASLKARISFTVTTTEDGQTGSTSYTGYQWFCRNVGLVKVVISYSITVNSTTVQYTITDELIEVSDG